MSPADGSRIRGVRRFRTKLLVAMMVVVLALTSLGIYLAQDSARVDAQQGFEREFKVEQDSLHRLQDLRYAAVKTRCEALAQDPRIHAALEDNALDLLYPSAKEELRDLMARVEENIPGPADALHAKFYRFLDGQGALLVPPFDDAGILLPNEEAQLAQPRVPSTMQTGYLVRQGSDPEAGVDEVIAVPIRSTESGDVIAALVLGFKPVEGITRGANAGMKSGILVNGQLRLPTIDKDAETRLAGRVARSSAERGVAERDFAVTIDGVPHQLFYKRLNLDSNYPPAYEVCVYPLTQLQARQRQLRWRFLGAGGVLLLGGFVASHLFSRRLSAPVEQLAVISEEEHAQREIAEAALQTTSEELKRSARFSADASHQLKSPITVLRVGLDSLLAREDLPAEVCEEIASLVHQTYRLTGVVEDLLLLSRMDAGRLQLNLKTVNLTLLVEEWVEDVRTLPESADLRIESDLPEGLQIAGEKKYTALVVQNLLDNARKYNRVGGVIRIDGREENGRVALSVTNTGDTIPPEAQPFIFERFQRAGSGENVAGHGLGLNLARDLVRLHGGELRLVRSADGWTEFRVIFLAARSAPAAIAAG